MSNEIFNVYKMFSGSFSPLLFQLWPFQITLSFLPAFHRDYFSLPEKKTCFFKCYAGCQDKVLLLIQLQETRYRIALTYLVANKLRRCSQSSIWFRKLQNLARRIKEFEICEIPGVFHPSSTLREKNSAIWWLRSKLGIAINIFELVAWCIKTRGSTGFGWTFVRWKNWIRFIT